MHGSRATMDEIHSTALWNTPTPVKITDESYRIGKYDSRPPGAVDGPPNLSGFSGKKLPDCPFPQFWGVTCRTRRKTNDHVADFCPLKFR